MSRAGKSYFDPASDFQLFPGDRLVLFGPRENVENAADRLEREHRMHRENETDAFALASLDVAVDTAWANRSIESLNFRKSYGVSILAIKRGEHSIASPTPSELILRGDRLILAGTNTAMKRLEDKLNVDLKPLEF